MSFRDFLILLIATANGAVVMGFEIIGSRILAPTFGGSIFVWGSLIGIIMAGLSAGYFIGGWLFDRKESSSGTLSALLLAPGLMMLTFPLYGFSLSEQIFLLDIGPRLGPLTSCTALFFIPTALMGAVSPYLVGMMLQDKSNKPGRAVGLVYALSTIGSIGGTLGTAFFLVLAMGTRASLYLFGGTLILLGIIALRTGQIRE